MDVATKGALVAYAKGVNRSVQLALLKKAKVLEFDNEAIKDALVTSLAGDEIELYKSTAASIARNKVVRKIATLLRKLKLALSKCVVG